MKVKARTKQEHEAQQFRFKPRAFKIDSIMESDTSSPVGSLPNEAQSEWQEWLLVEDVAGKVMILYSMSSLPHKLSHTVCANVFFSFLQAAFTREEIGRGRRCSGGMELNAGLHHEQYGACS